MFFFFIGFEFSMYKSALILFYNLQELEISSNFVVTLSFLGLRLRSCVVGIDP